MWALVIKSVKASDAGLYMCELNTEPPVRSFHRLTGEYLSHTINLMAKSYIDLAVLVSAHR